MGGLSSRHLHVKKRAISMRVAGGGGHYTQARCRASGVNFRTDMLLSFVLHK